MVAESPLSQLTRSSDTKTNVSSAQKVNSPQGSRKMIHRRKSIVKSPTTETLQCHGSNVIRPLMCAASPVQFIQISGLASRPGELRCHVTAEMLRQDLVDDMAMNISQADITTAKTERQLLVIDSQLMQNGGVDVLNHQRILDD